MVGVGLWIYFASIDGLKGTVWVWGLGACWTALIVGREQVHLSRSVPYFMKRWGWAAAAGGESKAKQRLGKAPAGAPQIKKTQ